MNRGSWVRGREGVLTWAAEHTHTVGRSPCDNPLALDAAEQVWTVALEVDVLEGILGLVGKLLEIELPREKS